MRHYPVILIAFLGITLSTPLLAQEEVQRRLGLGISIDPARLGQSYYYFFSAQAGVFLLQGNNNVPPVVFYLPIRITNRFRCEPSFGFYSTGTSTTTTATGGGSGQYPETNSYDLSFVTIGVRGAYSSSLSDDLALYFGPRLDFSFVSSTFEYSYTSNYPVPNTRQSFKSTSKETNITVGLVFGAEYFPVSQFSVGGEVGLNYTSFGDPELKTDYSPPQPPPTYTTRREQHATRTDALFLVRWYFL